MLTRLLKKITGYGREEVIGKNPRLLKSGLVTNEYYRQMWHILNAWQKWEGEFIKKKKNYAYKSGYAGSILLLVRELPVRLL